eukprot:6465733-Amphidinium_carterae.1
MAFGRFNKRKITGVNALCGEECSGMVLLSDKSLALSVSYPLEYKRIQMPNGQHNIDQNDTQSYDQRYLSI